MSMSAMRRSVAQARDLMESGRLLDAMSVLERFFTETWWYEDDPELPGVMAAARRLAGEVRGRMATTVLRGARSALSGAAGEDLRRAREGVLSDVRFLLGIGAIDRRQAEEVLGLLG